mmetsp:Transcript_24038/g.72400  ORF Transcript_24038/g.72400 Transcript_24038/m.72400 type:complete len:281 (-) Transcript_24038:22-864(-)
MGGSSKLDKLKALQKEGKKGIVVDKTFGLKNKNKSKKVQAFVQQVESTKRAASGDTEKARKDKKMSKLAKLQQEMELKALFSEGLSITVKKRDLHKKKDGGGGGGGGAGVHYDDAWAEAELKKAGKSGPDGELTLEQRIEKKRQEFRDKGIKGTPVTPETFAKWKAKKAKRLLDEKLAAQKAEALKKKGKSVLTGRDLYTVQKDLFVDDDEAEAAATYARQADDDDDDGMYDENGALVDQGDAAEARPPAAKTQLAGVGAVNADLYADEDDVDLEGLDDD